MPDLEDIIVKQLLPAGAEVRELDFCHSAPSIIVLGKAPLETVCQLQVSKLSLSIAVVSDGLARLHPRRTPWVHGISRSWIKVHCRWEFIIKVGGIKSFSGVQIHHHAVRHFNFVSAIACTLW